MSEENWLTGDTRGENASIIWNGLSHITDTVLPHLIDRFPDYSGLLEFSEIIGAIHESRSKTGFLRVNELGVTFQVQDFQFPIIRIVGDQVFIDVYYYPDTVSYATTAQIGDEFEDIL